MTTTILTATLARFTPAAHEASAETGANVEADLQRVLGGGCSRAQLLAHCIDCLLYTSPSPRDRTRSRMPSSA